MLISGIDGPGRRIFLSADAAVGGEIAFHPVTDFYADYRAFRAGREDVRPFPSFCESGVKLGRSVLLLLAGTRLVLPDGVHKVTVTGEILTGEELDIFDTSRVTGPCIVTLQPIEGYRFSLAQVATAILAAAQETPIAADMVRSVGTALQGDGTEGNKFRSVLVP